jgi:3-hydroxybutyryl-CoA dehydrogenase
MTVIENVGVVGGGQMGRGIAEVCARAGVPVTLYDVTPEAAWAGLDGIDRSLARAEKRGAITAPSRRRSATGRWRPSRPPVSCPG